MITFIHSFISLLGIKLPNALTQLRHRFFVRFNGGGWGYMGLYRAVWDVFLMAATITTAVATAAVTA